MLLLLSALSSDHSRFGPDCDQSLMALVHVHHRKVEPVAQFSHLLWLTFHRPSLLDYYSRSEFHCCHGFRCHQLPQTFDSLRLLIFLHEYRFLTEKDQKIETFNKFKRRKATKIVVRCSARRVFGESHT